MEKSDEVKAVWQRLEAAESAKQRLQHVLSVVSHELRNPMNAILGMSQMLLRKDDAFDEDVRKNIVVIHDAAKDILPLLDHCLDYLSDIEDTACAYEPFELRALLEGIIVRQCPKDSKTKVDVILNYGRDVPRYVAGDAARLSKVFSFVLANAMRFTEEGYVFITVTTGSRVGGKLQFTIEIEDTGQGIPEDKLLGICDLFTVSQTTHGYTNGGLRLSISKYLLTLLGGVMQITSQVGKGTIVKITLPLTVEGVQVADDSQWSFYHNRVKVLIINDNLRCAETFYRYLHSEKNQFCGLQQSVSLLQEALRKNDPFQIIILDEQVVEHETEQLTDLLMSIPKENSVLFIVTARNQHTRHMTLLKNEVTVGVIEKPILPSVFLNQLAEHWFQFKNRGKQKHPRQSTHYEPSLLLVEDNKSNARVAKLMLEELGCKVDIAENGEQALVMLMKAPTNYDLVFMDIGLPGKSGFETAALIKQQLPEDVHLPIVAMTAYVSDEDRLKCLDAGMVDILAKPVTLRQLDQCLQTHIAK